jgi:hypothetical protein
MFESIFWSVAIALFLCPPVFNYYRARDKAVADRRFMIQTIQMEFELSEIDKYAFIELHEELESVNLSKHRFRVETFRNPMKLYPKFHATFG